MESYIKVMYRLSLAWPLSGLAIDEQTFWTCLSMATLFTLATLVVYIVVPELKNLQGSLVRRYLASYLAWVIAIPFHVLIVRYLCSESDHWATMICDSWFTYFGTARVLWMNVMGFDIWSTFRKIPLTWDVQLKVREKFRLDRYSIYAWSLPIVFGIYIWIPNYFMYRDYYSEVPWSAINHFLVLTLFLIRIGVAISNIFFYGSTLLRIKNRKKGTTHAVDGVNEHRKNHDQWFVLYAKLFIILGLPTISLAVASCSFGLPILCDLFVVTLDVLQSIFIFFLYLWKDDVKRSFCKELRSMMNKLGSCFQRKSASPIDSEN